MEVPLCFVLTTTLLLAGNHASHARQEACSARVSTGVTLRPQFPPHDTIQDTALHMRRHKSVCDRHSRQQCCLLADFVKGECNADRMCLAILSEGEHERASACGNCASLVVNTTEYVSVAMEQLRYSSTSTSMYRTYKLR